MKTKIITLLSLTAAVACGCSEDFYNSMNETPTLTTSVNLSTTDTIKTSAKSTKRTYQLDVSSTDPNGNIDYLNATANNANLLLNGENVNGINVAIELSKERYEFNRLLEIAPTANGLHTIKVNVHDAFKTSRGIEKYVYSFDNMKPSLGISKSTQREDPYSVWYYFDFFTSFDKDTRWGGAIDSMFVKITCEYYIENTGDVDGGTVNIRRSVADPYPSGEKKDKYVLQAYLLDDGVDWFTDTWVWVKDNEGAVSDTLHFTLGHVE